MRCSRLESLPYPLPSREGDYARRGFTLMEVVLAIALSAVLTYLLTTAIELFLVRVDSSRSRVESAQLARTLLDQIAADLTATRLNTPEQGAGGTASLSGGPAGGGQGGGSSNGGQTNTGGSSSGPGGGAAGGGQTTITTPADVQGIYGTAEEIRIDRAALVNWRRAARDVDPLETATADDMPLSVRYYVLDGDRLSAAAAAQRGVADEETSQQVAGLYREFLPTAVLAEQPTALQGSATVDGMRVELLAPEVVKIEIAYFDGQDLLDVWDTFEEDALPLGVEIRLTLYEPTFQTSPDAQEQARTAAGRYTANELVEYRRFVRLPKVGAPQAAEALLPQAGGNAGNQSGGQPAGGGESGTQDGNQNGQQDNDDEGS